MIKFTNKLHLKYMIKYIKMRICNNIPYKVIFFFRH